MILFSIASKVSDEGVAGGLGALLLCSGYSSGFMQCSSINFRLIGDLIFTFGSTITP